MDNATRQNYDTSIGSNERSVVSATKMWGIVLALIVLFGVIMMMMFLTRTDNSSTGPVSSENTATRPAEP